ncbi:hypothetical protein BDN71DRAFT_1433246 [Pleurotus eryngii]|uniref:Uncharacterized protein n=1 Tax=Pleurotus eryngii TaxID=5323 RepID=A0A9P6DEG0_PLEER|nr:hypothetical protein BDN71DRAFT_1433246 [Pleurotus eryngii]
MPLVMDLAALLSVLTLVTQLSDKNKVDQLESEVIPYWVQNEQDFKYIKQIKWKVAELDAKSLSLDASEEEAETSKAMVEEFTRLSIERKFLKGRNDKLVYTICANLEQQCKDLMATIDSYAEDLSEYDQKIEDVWKAWDEGKTEAIRLNKKLKQAETDIQLYISQVKSLEEALKDSRSQSKIHHHDWTITNASTNMNESQHKWSNGETGTQLALAEAIIIAEQLEQCQSVTCAIKAGEKAQEVEEAKAAKEITNKKKKKAVIWNQSAQLRSDDAAKAITPQLCADTSTPSNCFLAETFNPVTANVTAGAVEPINLPFPINFHQPEALLPIALSSRVTLEMQTPYDSLTFEESIDNFLTNFGPYDGTGI